ncbi:MAG: trypsin-like peptidase domain-containing protein [Gemmatimonadota bacterium]
MRAAPCSGAPAGRSRGPRGGVPPLALALAGLAGAGAATGLLLVLAGRPAPPARPSEAAVLQRSDSAPAAIAESRRTAIVAAADRAGRSVVAISASSVQQANPYAGTVWEDFFPLLRQPRPVQSLGSGFVVSADGFVVTNEHVVQGAESVRVTLMDGREFPAEVVAGDAATDLAVLRIPAADVPVAPLGRSADLLIGEWAIAIGNPFAPLLADGSPSVTVGVISALHRDVRPVPGQAQIWTDMIQTDASINPGNSGGPLVNAAGEVIGVNSFILSRSGGSIGIGFAIPIDRARRIVDDLVRYGEVRLSWLGIHVADIPPGGSASGLEDPQVRVTRVDPGSPADAAGVRPGEGLLSAAGRRVLSELDWQGRQLEFRAGQPLDLELVREGARRALRVSPAADPLASAPETAAPLGLRVTRLTPALRSFLGARAERGLLVTDVLPGSPAQNIGLEPGDVLLAVNDERVDDPAAAIELLAGVAQAPRASLVWEREGQLFRWQG